MHISPDSDRSLANTVAPNLLELFGKLATLNTANIFALDRNRFGDAVKLHDKGVYVDVRVWFSVHPESNSSVGCEISGLQIFGGSDLCQDGSFCSNGQILLSDLPRISRIQNLLAIDTKAVRENDSVNLYAMTLVLSDMLWPLGSKDSGGDRSSIERAVLAKGFNRNHGDISAEKRVEYKKIIDQGPDGQIAIKLIWAVEHGAFIADKANPGHAVPARWFVKVYNPFARELSTDRANLDRIAHAELEDLFDMKSDFHNEDHRFCYQAPKIDELLEQGTVPE